jgi:hypothetical protein
MEIDRDILEVESRIAQRRLRVEQLARASTRRIVPVGLIGAGALGLIAVAGFLRRPRYMERRNGKDKGGLVGSMIGLATTLGLQLLRSQFGSPVNIAQRVLLFFKRKSSAGDIRQAQRAARYGG